MPQGLYRHTNNSDIINAYWLRAFDNTLIGAGTVEEKQLPIVVRIKGGPKSGHHGHAGRPGSVGGSVPGVGGISAEIAAAIKRMIPEKNRKVLDIPATGLPGAVTRSTSLSIWNIAYNPTTDTMVAGRPMHANLIDSYGGGEYDDFVKVTYDMSWGTRQRFLYIDTVRVHSQDITNAWDKGFKTAQALRDVGFPADIAVRLIVPNKPRVEYTLGEITKEHEDMIEMSLGELLIMYKGGQTTLQSPPLPGLYGKSTFRRR